MPIMDEMKVTKVSIMIWFQHNIIWKDRKYQIFEAFSVFFSTKIQHGRFYFSRKTLCGNYCMSYHSDIEI